MLLQAALVAGRGSLMCCEPEAVCCHGNARAFRELSGQHLQVGSSGLRAGVRHLGFVPAKETGKLSSLANTAHLLLQLLRVLFGYMLDKY